MTTLKQKSDEQQLIRQFKAARRTGTPLVGIETPDQNATIELLSREVRAADGKSDAPIVRWDVVRGLQGLNKTGASMLAALKNDPEMTVNPSMALALLLGNGTKDNPGALPDTCVFMLNVQMFWEDKVLKQALCNARDPFKLNGRTIALMSPALTLPAELNGDVVVFDEPLPTAAQLRAIVVQNFKNAELPLPADDVLDRAVDAVAGLHAFAVEQIVAMSLTPKGLDFDTLWEHKIRIIEETPGLSVWRDVAGFDTIGGNDEAKNFLRALADGEDDFRLVWWIDEIEKGLAAIHSDTSGVSQDQHQALLTTLQDERIPAVLLMGQAGSGKSAIAKAFAREIGGICVKSDLGAAKGSLVGESEQKIRAMIKTILAMGQNRVILVATCNDVDKLESSPELMRRFNKLPQFYFDLPTASERETIWTLKGTQFGVDVSDKPNDEGWTGAEIEACVETARRLRVTIKQSSKWMVPMAQSNAPVVERRRRAAAGKYLSSSTPGVYMMPEEQASASAEVAGSSSSPRRRQIRVSE